MRPARAPARHIWPAFSLGARDSPGYLQPNRPGPSPPTLYPEKLTSLAASALTGDFRAAESTSVVGTEPPLNNFSRVARSFAATAIEICLSPFRASLPL